MLVQSQIHRFIATRAYRRLIERLLPATACRGKQALAALARMESTAASAIGLALLRSCELAHMPTPLTRWLAARLSALRRGDGLFGEGPSPSIGASAVALRAMMEWRDLCAAAGMMTSHMEEALESSLGEFAALQESDGLLGNDPVGSAIALALLGGRPEFRRAVDVARLREAIDRCRTISGELHGYARAMAA